MTRNDAGPRLAAILAVLAVILPASGCGRKADSRPEPEAAGAAARVLRSSESGCVLAVFSPQSLTQAFPADGVCRAAILALRREPAAAAFFHWSGQEPAERWIRGRLAERRRRGAPLRLILAGHGAGGAAASETARSLLASEADLEIVLLLTVDAVKTDRLSATAGAAGSALVSNLPGVSVNFAAYDAAPLPDRRRFLSHVNYYQDRNSLCRGAPMPGAENHLATDNSGLLNHGNLDDILLPLLAADMRAALEKGTP